MYIRTVFECFLNQRLLFAAGAAILGSTVASVVPVQTATASSPTGTDIEITTDGVSALFSTHTDRDILIFEVRIAGPDQFVFEQRAQAGRAHWIPPEDLADGWYNWEAWVTSANPGALKRNLTPELERRRPDHWFDSEYKQTHLASGSFRVEHGLLIPVDHSPESNERSNLTRRMASAVVDFFFPSAHAQSGSYTNSVLINRGTSGPSLQLLDPDIASGLPLWRMQMTANPANHLEFRYCNSAIFGCASGTEIVPMVITRDTGRVGIGPVPMPPNSRLHINSGATEDPFRVQVGGNTRFFVSQNGGVTVGDFANPPPRGLYVGFQGNSGFGTNTPLAPIHVQRSNNNAMIRVQDSGTSDQTMFNLVNNAHPIFRLQDASQPNVRWEFRTAGSQETTEQFLINKVGSGTLQMRLFHNGDMQIGGTLEENSSHKVKHGIETFDPIELLAKLSRLEISKWSYNGSPEHRHFGPMAEDFYEIFKLGRGETTISPRNMASVALASAKALHDENTELRNLHHELQNRLARMEALLEEFRPNM